MEMISTQEFFAPLDGREYEGYKAMLDAIAQRFNSNLSRVPPQYSYLQLVDWALRHEWIAPIDDQRYKILVK